MKILLLHDGCLHWSIHNRCKAIAKFLPEGYDTYIISNAPSPDQAASADIIHINYTGGVSILTDLVKQYWHKTIMTLANERSLREGFGVDSGVLWWMVEQCNQVTSVSKRLAVENNFIYIPNGVDLSMFKEPKERVIGYIGTPNENKNYPLLSLVCGEMGYKILPLLHIENQIPFEEMPSHYRKLDALIHPSKTEGCSNVVLEALAMNVPVFVTKTGIWDDLEDFVTFIEPTREGIISALNKMNGRRLIERKFKWENIIERYRLLYERVIREPKHKWITEKT